MKKFIREYIFLDTKNFDGIELDMYPNIMLIALGVLLSLMFIYLHIKRKCTFHLISSLMRREAYGEDSAKSLGELRLDSPVLRLLLRFDGELRRLVGWVGRPCYSYEEYRELIRTGKLKREKIDFSRAKLYIDPRHTVRAKFVYENYEPSVIKTALCCLLTLMIVSMLVVVSPEILSLVSRILTKS